MTDPPVNRSPRTRDFGRGEDEYDTFFASAGDPNKALVPLDTPPAPPEFKPMRFAQRSLTCVKLLALQRKHKVITSVRGAGLMRGLELAVDAQPVVEAALKAGLRVNRTAERVATDQAQCHRLIGPQRAAHLKDAVGVVADRSERVHRQHIAGGGQQAEAGERVRITRVEGNCLIVEPARPLPPA